MRLFKVALVCFVIAGCAAGPRFEHAPITSTDDPVVYVFRTSGVYGVALTPYVYVNGREVGKLAAGGHFRCSVSPGDVKIGSSTSTSALVFPSAIIGKMDKKDITRLIFPAERGRIYFVRWQLDHEVVLVEQKQADTLIANTKLQKGRC